MKNKDLMQQLAQQIQSRLTDDELTVGSLSKLFFLSRSQLFRRTKAETGLSPQAFIAEQRLKKAHELLSQSAPPTVKKIAEKCGFGDAAYFSRAFRKRFGRRPSEVRDSRTDEEG